MRHIVEYTQRIRTIREMPKNIFDSQSNLGGNMDDRPLCLRVRKGLRDDLKQIPDWQNKLRDVIDEWVEEQLSSSENPRS